MARELNLGEMAEISAAVPEVELELFVHGAMCMAYSGRCFLSAFRTGRSSNLGDCTTVLPVGVSTYRIDPAGAAADFGRGQAFQLFAEFQGSLPD